MSTVPNFLDFTINAVLHPTFIRKLCYKLSSIVTFTFIQIFFIKIAPSLLNGIRVAAFAWYSVKIRVIFGVRSERQKVIKKQIYMKTETCKLYSRVIWIFLPNFIKIDPYNFELYCFKVGAFFETQCIVNAFMGRLDKLRQTRVGFAAMSTCQVTFNSVLNPLEQ